MGSSSNKRKFPRVLGKGVAAYLRLNGHNAGCTVQNISVGGVFVRTDRFLPVGTKLAFDLVKPGMKKALTVNGWVVGVITPELAARTRLPQGLRIQFAKMVPGATEALQELVGSLRRNPGAEPPVLYPLEPGTGERGKARSSRLTSSPSRALRPPPARAPSRALGDEPAGSTEVEMEARSPRSPAGMIDDSLLDSAGEADEELEEGQEELEDELGQEEESGEPEEEDDPGGPGPNPFDDEDRTIGVEPTLAKVRYGEGSEAKRPTAARGSTSSDLAELESTNRELQRLLERRETEIANLRAQAARLEQTLKERDEQLQLAKRVLKTNGLG